LAIVESRVLQISTSETSESEKELNLRNRKVCLKASNRKSINNAFANALNDPEATMPLKTRKKQVRFEVHIDSDSESLQGRSQENEEDSNSSSTLKILKLKPSIFRTRRGGDGMKDQNAFQDVLTENNVLNASTAKTSVAFEKESSQHSMHRNINTRKNVFADVLVYDSNASSSTSNPKKNKENNIHRSLIRKSPRLSLNKSKKQQSDVSVQDRDNIESNLSSSSFDNDEFRGTKRSTFFKPKSRILTRFRKRSTNPFEEILKQGKSSTTNEEGSYTIFLEVSSNAEKSRSKEANILSEDEKKLLENSDLNNASKSVSRKSVIAKSSEKKISNLKSIREKTLKEIACANAISPIGRLSTNVIIQDANNDSHADIDVEHVHSSESRSDKEVGFISSNKQSSSKKLNKIDDFFVKIKETSAKQLSERAQKSPGFDSEKMKKIKMELKKLNSREMAAMKRNSTDKKASAVKKETVKFVIQTRYKDTKKKKPLMNSTKVVDKAFLVNGKVYRPPRLPRPKHWATDRLYKFLWKRLEPKYKLATRVKSEKFVQELATVVTTIERRKNYENYKTELTALMKEMARLKLINTRMDFYHFCQDFLSYEFRVKVIPMTLPGNKSNIPFDPENVHTPLLDAE
ncbi:hypothetical protein ALC57_09307, partial [Trachymyrmex cornetzi]